MQRLNWLLSVFGFKYAFASDPFGDEDEDDEEDDNGGWEPVDDSEDNTR